MKKQAGLTLVEVLAAMGIVSIVGVLLVAIIVNSAGLFYNQSSKLQQGLNINDALSNVRGNIKEANSVANSYDIYTSGPTQLVLKIPSQNSSGDIILNTFDHYVYFLDQKTFRFKTFPDISSVRKTQNQIFSTNVDNLNFKYFDSSNPPMEVAPNVAQKVRITLTLKQKSGTDFEVKTATSEASLRND